MEDHPERDALAGAHRRDAVAHVGPVVAAGALDRAGARREDQEAAALEVDHVRARLRPRALLDEHELAALEVGARAVEDRHGLQRERDVAVEVLVQRVVAPLEVAQQQRRGALLAGLVAAVEERAELLRELGGLAEAAGPLVGEPRERRVERVARLLDRIGQRRVEVLVLALAEAVAAHVDRGAEVAVGVRGGELLALAGAVDRRGLDVALLVEGGGQRGPVELRDAVGDGHTWCNAAGYGDVSASCRSRSSRASETRSVRRTARSSSAGPGRPVSRSSLNAS